VKALRNINFKAKKGSIHCIVGENGAGKSTLMKIFSGVESKDSGQIKINGEEVEITDPHSSHEKGVGIIYQEFVLAPDMTVAENVFLDDLDKGKFFIKWAKINQATQKIIDDFGFHIRADQVVGDLSVAYMQIVEITKALAKNANILILDEPTAVLAEPEIKVLFSILRRLKDKGVTIIYISHRLAEVFEIADEITVFKDGESILTCQCCETDKDSIITAMIGREMKDLFPPRNATIGEEIFRTEGLAQESILDGVDISVRAGEVVGISGLVGSGRTEFAKAVFGIDRVTRGTVYVKSQPVKIKKPRDALRHRVGLVPENRKDQGLFLELPIAANVTMANHKSVSSHRLFLHHRREKDIAEQFREKLAIKAGGVKLPASSLSGGNQQKVALAKWLHTKCDILIFDEPTRGVDVGGKQEIYRLINELAEDGYGIVVISSEMLEIIGLCDRTYVFSEGRVAGHLEKSEMTEAEMLRLAIPASRAAGMEA
ncbi:MAG: sugar ABC transporter ATP-binding protein, partial [Planctomycetes bacterium]|nr:sugar ABC transporter ATP-binding protein [Planctomycetota bacterium]